MIIAKAKGEISGLYTDTLYIDSYSIKESSILLCLAQKYNYKFIDLSIYNRILTFPETFCLDIEKRMLEKCNFECLYINDPQKYHILSFKYLINTFKNNDNRENIR